MFQHQIFGMVGDNFCHDSQTMSAFIKCIRLRRTDDAIYWLSHHFSFWPKDTFRLTRRILMSAGEDCIDPPVQFAVSEWAQHALVEKDPIKWFRGAAAMVHLICATDNWWKTKSGSRYIAAFKAGESSLAGCSGAGKDLLLHGEMTWDSPSMTMMQHMLRHQDYTEVKNKTAYAQSLAEEARKRGLLAARIPASIHARYGKFLAKDDNYIGQTVFRIAFGPLGVNRYPKINPMRIAESVKDAAARLKTPEKTPKWVQDGIHCYGKDRRFAGILSSMVSCCRAYREYGRLDPADEHPPEFADEQALLQLIAKEP